MSLSDTFIPSLPFPEFKWRWATLQCTEGLNDPVVLLGVLSSLYQCRGTKYNSERFTESLQTLQRAVADSGISVNLAGRTGDRNIMRNSGQYWKALGLIPSENNRGRIALTRFGEAVAERSISQADFAATTILSLTLPNPNIETSELCRKWRKAGISLHPLALILRCLIGLYDEIGIEGAFISVWELIHIIIPLSSTSGALVSDYVQFILLHRDGRLSTISQWPDPTAGGANDGRMAREFLLFLANYGYLVRKNTEEVSRENEEYFINERVLDEIRTLLNEESIVHGTLLSMAEVLQRTSIIEDMERKRVRAVQNRPNQAAFRRQLMERNPRCIVTEVSLATVLEAAHIKPYAYKGQDNYTNGFMMRSDIHTLFDTGDLRISPTGEVSLSPRARMSYGETAIRRRIDIPDYINRSNLEWRWNYFHSM